MATILQLLTFLVEYDLCLEVKFSKILISQLIIIYTFFHQQWMILFILFHPTLACEGLLRVVVYPKGLKSRSAKVELNRWRNLGDAIYVRDMVCHVSLLLCQFSETSNVHIVVANYFLKILCSSTENLKWSWVNLLVFKNRLFEIMCVLSTTTTTKLLSQNFRIGYVRDVWF